VTFYLKYRPQTIDELDLTSVRESLKEIVSQKEIPHAFLFSGNKGSGKTSAARILAKIINCERLNSDDRKKGKGNQSVEIEPCNRCAQCVSITKGSSMDVVEIDAASHRGIDDIRSLKDSIALSPTSSRKKVYIIDEAHMLTTEASNAFLKALEEPPDHVVFILATTNPEKLPSTIRSRAFNINFGKATVAEIGRQLARIMKGEKINCDEGVIEIIAKASEGSFRDAAKLLEQLSFKSKNIKKIDAELVLFKSDLFATDQLLEYISKGDLKSALEHIENFVAAGGAPKVYLDLILEKLHGMLLADSSGLFDRRELINLINTFLTAREKVNISIISQLPMEMAIVEWCENSSKFKGQKLKAQAKSENLKKNDLKGNSLVQIDTDIWNKILLNLRERNASVEALLRAAFPISYDGKILNIGVYYRFHKERLENNMYRRVLEDVVNEVIGSEVRVICTLTEKRVQEKEVKAEEPVLTTSSDTDIIEAAKEIFEA
jgi:DNA polymerase-3 subunit gamma/tau